MTIQRPRGPKPTLKHLAFLEAMTEHREHSPEGRELRASLLTLRLFDEWLLLGSLVVEGSSPMLRATRIAVDALRDDGELQSVLGRIVDGILMVRNPDAAAVLPRLAPLADLFESRGATALAEDVRRLLGAQDTPPLRVSAPSEAVA